MFTTVPPLPFSIVKVHGGFSEASGLAAMNRVGLTLEYQVSVLGLFRLPIREVVVPFGEIISVTLKKNFLQTRIVLLTRSLRTLQGVPGNKTGRLVLRIARRDQEGASQLVSALRLYLSEQTLQQLADIWRPAELPVG
jgi:hypothetical protein